jgi:O-antigen/teichoic acid export membrane protein
MVLKNSFFYVASSLFPSVLAFLIVPFLTHALTPAEYGVLGYLGAIIMFLNSVYGLGFNTYIFKSFSIKEYQHSNFKMIHSTFWSLASVSVLLSIFFYIIFTSFQISKQIEVSDYAMYIIAIVFFTSLTIIPMSYLRIKDKAKDFFYLTISFSGIEYLLIVILVIYMGFGIEGKLLSRIVGYIFFAGLLLYFFRKLFFKNFFDKSKIIQALKFGPAFAIGTFLFILIDVVDRFILEHYVTIENLGLYSVAYTLAFVLMALNKGVTKALQPYIIKKTKLNDESILLETLNKSKRFINIVTFSSTIIFLLLIEFFVKLTFANSYHAALEYMLFLSIVPMFYAHYNIYSSVLIAYGKKKFFLTSMSYGLFVNIGFNLILIPFIGVYGAIISTILAYLTMLLFIYIEFKNITGISIKIDNSIYGFSIILSVTLYLVYMNFFQNILIQISATFLILSALIVFLYYFLDLRSKHDLANLLQ